MPDDPWAQAAAQFNAAPSAGQPQPEATPDWKMWSDPPTSTPTQSGGNTWDDLKTAGKGFLQGLNPVSGIAQTVMHPIDTLKSMGDEMASYRDQATQDWNKGNYADAAQHEISGVLPVVGPMASHFIDSAIPSDGSPPNYQAAGSALGQMASLKTTPVAAKVIGKIIAAGAVPTAESALGIGKSSRGYGRTPGRFALDETSGFKPDTVAESARTRVADLNNQLESSARASMTPASLKPARDIIDTRSATAAAGNSQYTPAELADMRNQLTVPQPGFQGAVDPATGQIAENQSAQNILRMKREFGKDFTKWNPLNPKGEMKTARGAYGALDKELDRTVPGAEQLNQRISSGIPVAERGEETANNSGVAQQILHKLAVPTGALVAATEGYRQGGIPGMVAGAVIPAVLSSPSVKMAAARGLNAVGNAAKTPIAGQAAAVAGTQDNIARRMGRQISQANMQPPPLPDQQ